MDNYGVPSNQLEGDTLNKLMNEVWVSGYREEMGALLSSRQSGCICVDFPDVTVPGGAGLFTNSTGRQRAANDEECGDCDLEVFFPVNTSVIRWISGVGFAYYTTLGGVFSRRTIPLNATTVLIGYGAVSTVFLGIEFLAQIAYRLDP